MQTPFLLPAPQRLSLNSGVYTLKNGKLLLLASAPQCLVLSAKRLQAALQAQGLDLDLSASGAAPQSQVGITLRLSTGPATPLQGYRLEINPDGIIITGKDEAGVFYGVCTLIQLLDQYGSELSCLDITDWPDFPARGVMLDISRNKVPSMETLYGLVDILAGWKINQFQLYTEHTFAYRLHPEVWVNASPMTGQEILDLDAYCRERFIELVPNQNSFGHLQRWLKLPVYQPMAEIIGTFESPWGAVEGPWSLCPTDERSVEFVRGLYDELLPHFTSRMVNVGCDETIDLGKGRSKVDCQRTGAGQVYLDYLMKIYRDLKGRNRTMQFWGDMILKYPEVIKNLPRDLIAMEWGYDAGHDFAGHARQFAGANIPFYVCPGTSSWNSLAGRSDNALGNLLNAAENGLKYGAIGYLNTDWGDNGHVQMLPVSYLGFAAGAAFSWALEANRQLDFQHALSVFAFRDKADALGKVAYELGNIYRLAGVELENSSALFWSLFWPFEKVRSYPATAQVPYQEILEKIDLAALPMAYVRIHEDENPLQQETLLLKEFEFTARLLRHACWRGMLAQGATTECPNETQPPADSSAFRQKLHWDMQSLMFEYEDLWLKRNRLGGLNDSLAHFEQVCKEYI